MPVLDETEPEQFNYLAKWLLRESAVHRHSAVAVAAIMSRLEWKITRNNPLEMWMGLW
jgi:hypothetical protein